MDSSSPPQSDLGGSGYLFGGSQWNVVLKLKPTKKERKKEKRDRHEIVTVLDEERHEYNIIIDPSLKKIAKWRMKERMKTVAVALVYCLNIGVDPPDSLKTDPCARDECWIDPLSMPAPKALESIGKSLQLQYEHLQPRARYKLSLDPTVDEVKKLCLSLRRNAKDERVLYHYNGHGVPRPTANGEIWVFNKNFTQYIPLSIYELQSWMGSPSIYVFDCSAAGLIVHWFTQFAEQREKEYERMIQSANGSPSPSAILPVKDFILLASCGATETLPVNPKLPADVFTSCLTTPIKMALRWFCTTSLLLKKGINFDLIDKIPGRLVDRKTPLGELNWIFTAITDTIAWNVLPIELFQKLFRQDLLVASLFRNFLLAERIMRPLNCTPLSFPKLPPTHLHPMWQAWDLAVDLCLSQIPEMLENPSIEYKNSPFFTEQLTAFEVWLEYGSESKKPPEQLPIVLQVLLSTTHRLRALVLLAKFLDLGPWAVNLALSVGIFPYVLKLLQSAAMELRQVLVFIWTKILALDKSCQLDLVKDNGHNYFLSVLSSSSVASEQRTMAAFILSVIVSNCRPGQSACLNGNLVTICLSQLSDPDPMLRRWLVLCLAKLWDSFEEAKWAGLRDGAPEKLCSLLSDPIPEVRAAAVYALALFVGGAEGNEQRTMTEMNIALTLPIVLEDGSPLVRKELAIALARFVKVYEKAIKEVAKETLEDEVKQKVKELHMHDRKKNRSVDLGNITEQTPKSPEAASNYKQQQSSIYACLWKLIITLNEDPYPQIARVAESIVRSVLPAPPPNLAIPHPLYRSASATNVVLRASTPQAPKAKSKKLINLTQSLHKSGGSTSSPTVSPPNPGASPAQLKKTSSLDYTKGEVTPTEEDRDLLISANPDDLQSAFYDWSCDHFSKKLLMIQPDEPESSTAFVEKIWREKKIEQTLHEGAVASRAFALDPNNTQKIRLDEQVALIDNTPESASSLLLHPFEPLIVVADDKDGISVYDRETCVKMNHFKNRSNTGQMPGTPSFVNRTTSMALMNEMSSSLLATGSDDGIIRVWTNYDDLKSRLVSSWSP
eukprot:TRINITY_DN2516_c0_g1_i5.p1 TRINITY_DN2516_c0_g1~~TRINITY_DN2516_c0_g1_i5.p1  ORF type:complete len:1063 (+),score=306.58 TRINITY_DN2516_c0_g1_i5:92-3280(+)